ncbi:MAG: hypothetical protein WAU47_05235 [Desulfobaccales bacterium]
MKPGLPTFVEVAQGVLEGGYGVHLHTRGDSMTPLIRGGSVIQVEQVEAGGLKLGDVLVYRDGGRLVAHRLIAKRQGPDSLLLITRGDAAPWRHRQEVAPGQVLGRVCAVKWRRGLSLRIDSGWGRVLSLILGVSWPLPQGIFFVLVKVKTGLDRLSRSVPA